MPDKEATVGMYLLYSRYSGLYFMYRRHGDLYIYDKYILGDVKYDSVYYNI